MAELIILATILLAVIVILWVVAVKNRLGGNSEKKAQRRIEKYLKEIRRR